GRHRRCSPADLRASVYRPPAECWGTSGVGLGMETAGGITVTGHALKNADRLLIRPASGRQADTGLSARTNHWKDTRERGHSGIESRTKRTERQPDKRPRRD